MTVWDSRFLVGVNYWPRTKAMFWWKQFDPEEVQADMAEIASWNLDGVRIFLTPMLDFLRMHAYSVYAPWARHPLDEQILPFLTRLTASLSGKPVLFEEFGLPTAPPGQPTQWIQIQLEDRSFETTLVSEEEAAAFYERALEALHQAGAIGAFLWCFSDYHPDLWDRPLCDRLVHERHFGLLRPDGSRKPAVEVVARFAAQKRPVLPPPAPLPVPKDYEAHPGEALRELYALFVSVD